MTEDAYILLVDDSENDVELMLYEFKRQKFAFRVEAARDGKDALALLTSRLPGNLPRLVVLDLKMPKVDGFETLTRIRADTRLRHLSVLVLTSSDHERDVLQASHLGATLFLQKPTQVEQYADVVREISAAAAAKPRR